MIFGIEPFRKISGQGKSPDRIVIRRGATCAQCDAVVVIRPVQLVIAQAPGIGIS